MCYFISKTFTFLPFVNKILSHRNFYNTPPFNNNITLLIVKRTKIQRLLSYEDINKASMYYQGKISTRKTAVFCFNSYLELNKLENKMANKYFTFHSF